MREDWIHKLPRALLTGINRIKTWSANVCVSRKDWLICLYYFRGFGITPAAGKCFVVKVYLAVMFNGAAAY